MSRSVPMAVTVTLATPSGGLRVDVRVGRVTRHLALAPGELLRAPGGRTRKEFEVPLEGVVP